MLDLRTLARVNMLGCVAYQGSASVGAKVFLGDSDHPEQILKAADSATYDEKRGVTA